ncbi:MULTISPECIES: hypothetical protein [Flavobacterium]|jgi:hypothetical protein|uniref:Uncharacterized protein n=1 Tax=Flavobacterium cupriresistens TaxID=2893885 RepID=A0ABU4R8Z7_9FLAO|nr:MULTISPECIES: hypothetical protein [unclassified Flavobacterium]KLT71281.1 hypothetical protein AB674_01975 [Flavobacterium sp. ABG]MDX6188124.1 hypothetical protein [Flavobacterium sp. Fl-318]UFH41955.1 hypothetical protein LNP23_19360 [Flavobacterium sp. F-323]
MSNLIKNNKIKDEYSHNEKAYKFIDEHLPYTYVELTIECLVKKGHKSPSKTIIRNVRNKIILRNDILLALVEVANDNKIAIEKIKVLTT